MFFFFVEKDLIGLEVNTESIFFFRKGNQELEQIDFQPLQ